MNLKKPGLPLLTIQIKYEPDIVTARRKTRDLAEALGFDSQDQARIGTAVSELARNVFQYAQKGTVEFFFNTQIPQALLIKVSDRGPGIANLHDILGGVYISPSGMGVGLIGSKKLMDIFELETSNAGTEVLVGKTLSAKSKNISNDVLVKIVESMATKKADDAFEEIQLQNRELLAALDELTAKKNELSELNAELEETNKGVLALYAELDEKAESLQHANEVKTSFLSNMTHEFRTPLSSIISLTRLLIDRVDGDLTPEQERQVNYIRKSGESLLELVNDLLDLAKVEAGKVSVNAASFDVEELMGSLRGMFRPIIGDRESIEFTVDWDENIPELNTDQPKVAQILRNLISNAVKFTEKGRIQVNAKQVNSENVLFTVADSGIGISDEHHRLIFEDYSQIDSKVQKKHKGTGLGLPLSRKLARMLGGDLWVESKIGSGSIFHVLLPIKYEGNKEAILIPKNNSPMPTEITESNSKFKVLLIDDDEPSRYILRGLISSQLSADFIEVQTGEEGLVKIKTLKPDVVFLDLNMPGLSGFDVLDKVQSDPNLKDTPIIINTAKKLSEYEIARLEHASAILSKERTDHQRALQEMKSALVKVGFDYQ
ncbi:ATP-binding protein [Bdellovibrio sp. SKB1291214]|uniref:ATP-binding protein n=1 Tax=Bdellovibrio sp. SKB1291214 TaxID=1732569 RepID=UPI000B515750|nr:ATP-binding protein [Bdellovibrio sp. SKB1291214]UYL07424.1 ATP-binding protein [Bdellovibrio sp. SKB1291214]